MTEQLPDILLSRFSEFIASQMGLHFPKERRHDLERGIDSAAKEFGFKELESCIKWLISSSLTRDQIEILASHLTIGETYFFREKRSFEILEGQILPDLIRSRQGTERRLRIWSAGCCTGEEPYSIAILLSKIIPDLKEWNITILATDINPLFLKKAQDGLYTDWSFRDTPSWIKERYFKKKKDGRLEILPDIKKMATFSYLNLAEDAYPSLLNNTNAIDLIFCRNVLIYFTHEKQARVVLNLYRSLIDGGWLIVSPSETSQSIFSQFTTVNFQDAIIYRKKGPGGGEVVVSYQRSAISDQQTLLELTPPTLEPGPRSADLQPPIPEFTEQKPVEKAKQTPYDEALALYKQGRYEETVNKIIELPSNNQSDPEVTHLLSKAYANQGRLSEALAWCEKAIEQDKLNAGLYYLRATILQELGEVNEAVISLKRALYLDQDLVLAYFALGNLEMKQGRPKESERHFQNALLLLGRYRQEDVLPESEGMTAGRMMEIIRLNRRF